MKSLPNIEKSGFHCGEYVGYGGGTVWRIHKAGKTSWCAIPRSEYLQVLHASTLAELSTQLEKLK